VVLVAAVIDRRDQWAVTLESSIVVEREASNVVRLPLAASVKEIAITLPFTRN
jgi:hypothetical protein